MGLLFEEPNGLAADFTDTDDYVRQTWQQRSVRQRADVGINLRSSPHEFFTQSGTSPKYVKGATYSLEWSPHNMLTRSQELDHSDWDTVSGLAMTAANLTRAPDGSLTADRKTWVGTGNEFRFQSCTVVVGATYTFSIWAKSADGSEHDFVLRETANDDFTSVKTATTEWQRFTVTATAATTPWIVGVDFRDDFGADTTGDVYVWGAQLNRGPLATAYIATTSAAKVGLPISYGEGLLTEPAATNVALQSEALGTTWIASQATINSDATTAPDGASKADELATNGVSGFHAVYQTTLSTGATATVSAYMKANDLNYGSIRMGTIIGSTRWAAAIYDLQNGTVSDDDQGAGLTGSHSASIVAVGNGWYRCTLTATDSNTIDFAGVAVFNAATDTFQGYGETSAWSGTAGHGIYVWGVQAEAGAVATSYIPTFGSTATRARDQVKVATSDFAWADSNGTWYLDFSVPYTTQDLPLVQAGKDTNNLITTYLTPGGNLNMFNLQGGSTDVDATLGVPSVNTRTQATQAFAVNSFAGSMNGAAIVTDSSATLSTGYNVLAFHNEIFAATPNQLVRRFVYVPRRVVDGDLPNWRYEA